MRIPAGVTEGSRIRVAGEGGRGTGSAPSGDLYLRVQLKPHPVFEVKGRDVYTRDAGTGADRRARRRGRRRDARSQDAAAEAAAGHAKRPALPLRGHGLPSVGKPDERGDLYANVEVDIPKTLTDEEREHYEALKAKS